MVEKTAAFYTAYEKLQKQSPKSFLQRNCFEKFYGRVPFLVRKVQVGVSQFY